MEARKLGVIEKGQDGVVFRNYLFRFHAQGACTVYQIEDLADDSAPVSRFVLDKAHIIAPHSNSVAFGSARYCETDEFPLLYSNVYNNYAKTDSPMKGITCVYRLERNGSTFSTTLLQLIEIGFTEDPLWRSSDVNDVRPYGNFAIDAVHKTYYAYTMRDEEQTTRYFSFDLPDVNAGVHDETLGVKRIVLGKEDIRSFFDCAYHHYVQGACYHNGIIYSLEGFTDSQANPPTIRLIDVNRQRQERVYYLADYNMHIEPELIDFKDEICYYADHTGNVFVLDF